MTYQPVKQLPDTLYIVCNSNLPDILGMFNFVGYNFDYQLYLYQIAFSCN